MIKLKEISIGFMEGPASFGNRKFDSFEAFDRHMSHCADHVKADLRGREWLGYYKADVTVIWEDGDSWADRYDMGEFGKNDNRTLAETIRHYQKFYSGAGKPYHMTQDDYETILRRPSVPKSREFYNKIVAGYQLD